MPLIVLDTSISLPATLSRRGAMTRKLWALLAYGALTYRVEHLQLDRAELVALADETGGEVAGLDALDRMVDDFEHRRAAVAERLPPDAPTDLVAVGFAALFDEYERKLRDIGARFQPGLTADEIAMLRRQCEAICVVGPTPFTADDVPTLTPDKKDDPIVYGALLADADYLISDDRHIVPDQNEHTYGHEAHRTLAVTFNRFAQTYMRPQPFDWDGVDPGVLTDALRRLGNTS